MNPPPPMLPASGSTTSRATATAASMALPPSFRTSTPAALASGCAERTIACCAVAGRDLSVQVAGMTGLPRTTGEIGAGATEQRNPRTDRIDTASSLEIVDLMNAEDARVPGIVHGERERIARAIDLIVAAFLAGGRLEFFGVGPSGRPWV